MADRWQDRLRARLESHEDARRQVPKAFGRLQVTRRLGAGGMGEVFEAHDPELDRRVAVKTLGIDRFDEPEAIERFQREAEAVARLDHPGVVRIHEVACEGLRPYLVLELVEGGSLADLVRDAGGCLPPLRAAELTLELARALAHAHARGVLHRDVKPANVLIDADGRPRLTDFGLSLDLAEERERLTATNVLLGSPTTMSPEQAASKRELVGPATDVYGLGATLYLMLTGRPPCVGQSVAETVLAIANHRPSSPEALSPAVDAALGAVCLRCLEKDPQARYASAQELADALEAYLGGSRPAGKPWLVALVVALALLAAWGWQATRPDPAADRGPAAGPSPTVTPPPSEPLAPTRPRVTVPVADAEGAAVLGSRLVTWTKVSLRFHRVPSGEILKTFVLLPARDRRMLALDRRAPRAVFGVRPHKYLVSAEGMGYLGPDWGLAADVLPSGQVLASRISSVELLRPDAPNSGRFWEVRSQVRSLLALSNRRALLGQTLGARDGVGLELFDLQDRASLWTLPTQATATALALHPDGRRVAVGAATGHVDLLDLEERTLHPLDSPQLTEPERGGHVGRSVDRLLFWEGDLYSISWGRRELICWDPEQRVERWRWAPSGTRYLELDGDGRVVLVRERSVELVPLETLPPKSE